MEKSRSTLRGETPAPPLCGAVFHDHCLNKMPEPLSNSAVVEFLQGRGYTPAEIDKILVKLAAYDAKTVSDAIYDSIGRGTFTLDEVIRQALEE